MGDEQKYPRSSQSNSGHGACEITRGGKRSDGVNVVVDIVSRYPGIDSFGASCVHAGMSVEWRDGQYHLVGKTRQLSSDELAKVIKIQARFADASSPKIKAIVETKRSFYRPVKSTGYRVAGGGSFPDPNLPKLVVAADMPNELVAPLVDAGVMADGVEDKPVEVVKVGMPANFASEYLD